MKIINFKNIGSKSYIELEITLEELKKYNLRLGEKIGLLEIFEKQ